MKIHPNQAQRGSALLVVSIMIVLMAVSLASVGRYVHSIAKVERSSDSSLMALYAAEAALELAYLTLRDQIFADTTTVPTLAQTTAQTNLTQAPVDQFPEEEGYIWRAFLTVPLERGVAVDSFSAFDPNRDFGNVRYLTTAIVDYTAPGMTEPIRVHLQRELVYSITPLYRYAIFYNSDAELFPGPVFEVTGDVHVNGTLYYGSGGGNNLNFAGKVTSTEGSQNAFHPDSGRSGPGTNVSFSGGAATVTTTEKPPFSFHDDPLNPNMGGARELIEIPDAAHSDPHAENRMYNQAGLKILMNQSAAPITAPDGTLVNNGARVIMTADGTPIPPADPIHQLISTTLANGVMQDNREEASVKTTDINVGALASLLSSGDLPATIPNSGKWPGSAHPMLRGNAIPAELQGKTIWNGIVYATDVGHSAANRVGVRLVNGAILPQGGFTVATENPAYIVGNYNTGGNPPSNTVGPAAANYVAGYETRGSAVVADAVNIVSENWIAGGYNGAALAARVPNNTTVNTAIIAGIVSSKDGHYSGGIENYPRLLENWNSRRLTYYGSMINLFESQQSNGRWGKANVYNAPQRNWYFDINFLDPDRLPPGFIVSRSLKKGQWVQLR
jgi:hypothetical protein